MINLDKLQQVWINTESSVVQGGTVKRFGTFIMRFDSNEIHWRPTDGQLAPSKQFHTHELNQLHSFSTHWLSVISCTFPHFTLCPGVKNTDRLTHNDSNQNYKVICTLHSKCLDLIYNRSKPCTKTCPPPMRQQLLLLLLLLLLLQIRRLLYYFFFVVLCFFPLIYLIWFVYKY